MTKQITVKEANMKIYDSMESLLDMIYRTLEKTAKDFKTKEVPLNLVKKYHEIALKNYKKGLLGEKEEK